MSSTDDYDVAVVGGGPAGCSATVFLAREELDTVVFDRGRSSIRKCAYLENYLGFPDGIDVETFYELMHDHIRAAGCDLRSDLVESVEPDGEGFVVVPQESESVTARRVVAATRYDGEYLRGLDDEEAMFETIEHGEETVEQFDREYADTDGTTPIEGLYVASPATAADKQAIMAAGRGARVAHRVVADSRLDDGWWPEAADHKDWMRRAASLDDEWTDREQWVEWFEEYYGDDAPVDPGEERFERVKDAYIDDQRATYLTDEEIDARATTGHEALASALEADAIVDGVGAETLLEAIDDEAIRDYRSDQHEEVANEQ
ncbi:FAD-binding protein [Natronomonas sp. CBA1123]|uniref:NAD(P)/FAD-dependent oxidoreductase n=1 Tax=Natronomonas sp. CBA1123 TaxID=2668070 RepID=UPI00130CBF4F|nr:FAD-binding protein [Natronomonas sp. CBA1123]